MFNLIQMEWYRFRKSISTYAVLASAAAFLSMIFAIIVSEDKSSATVATYQQTAHTITTKNIFQYFVQGDILILFIVFFAVLFLNGEFVSGYIKNIYGKEGRKYRLPLSIMIVSLIFVAALFILSFLISIIGQEIACKTIIMDIAWGDFLKFVGVQYLLNAAFCALMLCIYYLIGNNIISIAIGFFYAAYSDTLYKFLDSLLSKPLHKLFPNANIVISNYTLVGNMYAIGYESTGADIVRAILVSFVIGAVALCISSFCLKKKDIL